MLAEQTEMKLRECAAVDCSTVFALARHPNGGWTRKRFCGARCQRRHRDRRLHGHLPVGELKRRTAERRAAEAAAVQSRRDQRSRQRLLRQMVEELDRMGRRLARPCPCAACQAARGREAARLWRIANPEAKRASRRTYKALSKGALGSSTAAQDQARFDYYGGCCAYCGVELGDDWHFDHVIPLSRGGTNWPGNLRPSCPGCNLSK